MNDLHLWPLAYPHLQFLCMSFRILCVKLELNWVKTEAVIKAFRQNISGAIILIVTLVSCALDMLEYSKFGFWWCITYLILTTIILKNRVRLYAINSPPLHNKYCTHCAELLHFWWRSTSCVYRLTIWYDQWFVQVQVSKSNCFKWLFIQFKHFYSIHHHYQ